MKLTQEEFLRNLEEGQHNLLNVLADDPDVDTRKFFRVANALELINMYGGVIYSIISPPVEDQGGER